jgi:hypothetical protein
MVKVLESVGPDAAPESSSSTPHHPRELPGAPPIRFGAVPFRTSCEVVSILRPEDEPPALVLNPQASALGVAAAIRARAQTLADGLNAWCRVGSDCEVPAAEVAGTLEPTAQEIVLLIDALVTRLRAEGAVQ